MNTRQYFCAGAIALASVAGHAGAAGASQNPTPPPSARAPQADAAPDSLSDAELSTALDAYAIVQAQRQLAISDDKYRVFAARLKRVQDVRRRNQRARQQLVQQLRKLAGARAGNTVDEPAITAVLTALREHDDRAAAELQKAYDALDEVLDVRQRARFRLFEEQIELRKLDLLMQARERARKNRRE